VSSADFSRLTAIVHTCDRRGSVDRLIKSVGWACPQLRVLVADDSSKPQPVAGADLVKTPAGAGVSACRNTLLSRVRTPYFLLLEDGMELNRRSNVERLLELVSSNQLDIAAGDVVRCQRRLGLFTSRQPDPAHVTFEFESDTLRLVPGAASRGVPAPGAPRISDKISPTIPRLPLRPRKHQIHRQMHQPNIAFHDDREQVDQPLHIRPPCQSRIQLTGSQRAVARAVQHALKLVLLEQRT
jgi:hypothetical protein